MTKQQLAAFNVCFDNCLTNHASHTWFEATVEGFNAAMGQTILKLTPEEISMCKELHEATKYREETYNRNKAIVESYLGK